MSESATSSLCALLVAKGLVVKGLAITRSLDLQNPDARFTFNIHQFARGDCHPVCA